MVGWVGVENEINANYAFNLVGVKVEVEAELGNIDSNFCILSAPDSNFPLANF